MFFHPRPPAQRYYRGHNAAVLATAVHPHGTIVASAGLGAEPAVHVWESTTVQSLAILRGAHSAVPCTFAARRSGCT